MAPITNSDFYDYSVVQQLANIIGDGTLSNAFSSIMYDTGYIGGMDSLPFENRMRFYNDTNFGGNYNLVNATQLNMQTTIQAVSNDDIAKQMNNSAVANGTSPFLVYELTNIKTYEWYINNLRVINNAANYGKPSYLTASLNGMLIQEQLYNDLYDIYFVWLCSPVDDIREMKGWSNWRYDCYCDGYGFGGMPSLYVDTVANANKANSYIMTASDILYYPKVSLLSRSTSCRLGVANMGFVDPNLRGKKNSLEDLVLGRVFIRKFKMGISFTWDKYIATVYMTPSSSNSDFFVDLTLNSSFIIMLSIFICCMTKMRVARFNKERENFKRLSILAEEDPKITLQLARFNRD